MGGAPRIIKKVIETPKKIISNVGGGGSQPDTSPVTERRVEVAKKTEATEKKVAPRKLKRRSRKRTQLMASVPRPGLETGSDYSPIRNPRDSGSKLGSA